MAAASKQFFLLHIRNPSLKSFSLSVQKKYSSKAPLARKERKVYIGQMSTRAVKIPKKSRDTSLLPFYI